MSNTYFRFKKFIIHQNQCAMKVCTDSCLFGAWLNDLIQHKQIRTTQVLEVGSGTGLLSLMLATEHDMLIDTVEIDLPAYEQSIQNIRLARQEKNIQVNHLSFQDFKPSSQYELIFTNPPFFLDDLKSPDQRTSMAKHSTSDFFEDLVVFFNQYAKEDAHLAILIQGAKLEQMLTLLKGHQLYPERILQVSHRQNMPFSRVFLLLSRNEKSVDMTNLYIKDGVDTYTAEFRRLLEPYYLAF